MAVKEITTICIGSRKICNIEEKIASRKRVCMSLFELPVTIGRLSPIVMVIPSSFSAFRGVFGCRYGAGTAVAPGILIADDRLDPLVQKDFGGQFNNVRIKPADTAGIRNIMHAAAAAVASERRTRSLDRFNACSAKVFHHHDRRDQHPQNIKN